MGYKLYKVTCVSLFACSVILHAFLASADIIFQNILFSNNSFSLCQTVWIQIRPEILSDLILVQTVCKGDQQTIKATTFREWVDMVKSLVCIHRHKSSKEGSSSKRLYCIVYVHAHERCDDLHSFVRMYINNLPWGYVFEQFLCIMTSSYMFNICSFEQRRNVC